MSGLFQRICVVSFVCVTRNFCFLLMPVRGRCSWFSKVQSFAVCFPWFSFSCHCCGFVPSLAAEVAPISPFVPVKIQLRPFVNSCADPAPPLLFHQRLCLVLFIDAPSLRVALGSFENIVTSNCQVIRYACPSPLYTYEF